MEKTFLFQMHPDWHIVWLMQSVGAGNAYIWREYAQIYVLIYEHMYVQCGPLTCTGCMYS